MKRLERWTAPRRGRAVLRALVTVTVLGGALAACDAVLGIGDYQDRVVDGGTDGTAAGADGMVGLDAAGSDGAGSDATRLDAASGPDSAIVCGSGSGAGNPGPSCKGLAATCGSGTADCCASSLVPCGTSSRDGDGGLAAVSDFRLDTYEITVGRFRKFVAAYTGQAVIAAGAGKNPNNAYDPGWNSPWNASLPASASALATAVKCDAAYATWTDAVGGNETRPMNCITWFEAEAFCTWDGGRLPTEAEWQYAAAGGSDNRTYPWGSTAPAADASRAVYGCFYNGVGPCTGLTNIATVGSVSAGNAKWGQADMAGNVHEWVQDSYGSAYPPQCTDCAVLEGGQSRVWRGGGFNNDAMTLPAAYRNSNSNSVRFPAYGARCARTP